MDALSGHRLCGWAGWRPITAWAVSRSA